MNSWLNPTLEKLTLRYVIVALFFLFVVGVEGCLMRVDLCNIPLHKYEEFFAMMTAHPVVGIYGWAYIAVMGAFYYLVPKLLNRNLHSVRLAMIGLVIHMLGVIVAWSACFFLHYAPLYTIYWPLPVNWNIFPPSGALTFTLGLALIEFSILLFIFNIFSTILRGSEGNGGSIKGFIIAAFNLDKIASLINRKNKFLNGGSRPPVFIVSVMRGSIDAVINALILIMAGLLILIYSIYAIIGVNLSTQLINPLIYKNVYWWGLDMVADGDVLIWTAGVLYLMAPLLANRPLYGENIVRYVILADLIISMGVWSHHLLSDTPQPALLRLISGQFITWGEYVTMGLSFFAALKTLWLARPLKMNIPLKFMLGGILGFMLGGVSGLIQANYALNVFLHNTQWVIGTHAHMMLLAGLSTLIFAVIYTLLPSLTGKELISMKLSNTHFMLWMIGSIGMSLSLGFAGIAGMLRRNLYHGITLYIPYMYAAIIFAVVMALGYLSFIINIVKTYGIRTILKILIF
ncbi:MAG: cbb3-type cytochrome c oxidase subunit I [Candidatus Methanomethylicia archaeon]